MKPAPCAFAVAAMLAATAASAQTVNLTGAYRCVEKCRAAAVGAPAFITQNGPTLNLVDETGQPSPAWPDTFAPTTKIWVEAWNTGAVYSPDGMMIQFDNGTIWQRDIGPPPPPVRVRVRRAEVR